jgi:ABC-type transport system involved in cytochrome c biogenesis permease subunit
MRQKILIGLAAGGTLLLIGNLYEILLVLPDEKAQGAIYRIFFFHVPAWITCFSAYFLAGMASIVYLAR